MLINTKFILIFINRRSVFYRCIPEDAILTGTALGHTFYDWLNSKGPLKKTITDLMNSYKEMTIMCCVAISAAFFTAFTIHYVAAVASWIIMIFVSFALIGKNKTQPQFVF